MMGNRKNQISPRRHGDTEKIKKFKIMIFVDFGVVGNSQSIGVKA